MKAEKREQQRKTYREACHNNESLPHGGRTKRSRRHDGELQYRKTIRRNINRRDRRMVNMQVIKARFFHEIDVTGRPFANLIDSTNSVTIPLSSYNLRAANTQLNKVHADVTNHYWPTTNI